MKKILLSLIALFSLQMAAQVPVHYGFAPDSFVAEEIQAQGTGENAFVAGMICLDPTTDPVVKRLKGHQVKGVRCFLRADYKQKRQKYTYIMHASGTPDAESVKTYCNFEEGWNEILFDTPVTIGDEKLFVGLQVYEVRGTPYPFVSYAKASVPGGCWINLKREGWTDYTDRGTLFIQAILDDEAAPKLERNVYARAASVPLVVTPSTLFNAKVYFHNRSTEPVNSVELLTQGQGDTDTHLQTVTFDTPIPAYGAATIDMQLRSGSETGTSQWIQLTVPAVNGKESQEAAPGITQLYITDDAFVRIPLVEEFTSQVCTNCPFMIYYLDKAMEEYDGPVLYVTHHSGFQKDAFTLPMDEELLYLFGTPNTYNPAVMYDRRVAKGEIAPVLGANEASTAPYLAAINDAAVHPAMAKVLVDVEKNGDQISCRVHGRINRELAQSGEKLYLSAYLIENGISAEKYPQLGLDGEGAPSDLLERFRHNGVKRHVFNTEALGDLLAINENCDFSVDFTAATLDASWNWDNCQVIAFVHKVDKENMYNNEVVNAGSNLLNGLVNGIHSMNDGTAQNVRFKVSGNRTIQPSQPLLGMKVYDMSGKRIQSNRSLPAGAYIIRYTLPNGKSGTQKLLVK